MKLDPKQVLYELGWTVRPGAKPSVVVAEHPKYGRRLYAGSPKAILRHLNAAPKRERKSSSE